MDSFKKGWFTELSPVSEEGAQQDEENPDSSIGASVGWPGQAFSIEVDRVLFHERSKFQDVLVFKSVHPSFIYVVTPH